VLAYNAVVNLDLGTMGATSTVDAKIQHANSDLVFSDWYTWPQFIDGDEGIKEKEYTGGKQYIRVTSVIGLFTVIMSANVIRHNTLSNEDDLLSAWIESARQYVEDATWRKFITQTHDLYLDRFEDKILIPFGNLQSVTHVKYFDSDGTENTLTEGTDYIVETNGEAHGRVLKAYGATWPSFTPYPSNPVRIRFICGYGDAASDVPGCFKDAVKLLAADFYDNRGAQQDRPLMKNDAFMALLAIRMLSQ
jgi:uncharacterized phiE125 gp8 family phage protein